MKKIIVFAAVLLAAGMIIFSFYTAHQSANNGAGNYGGDLWENDVSSLAGSLCAGCDTDREKAVRIYQWVIENIEYDYELEVQYQYFDASKTLATRKGVCFDMANLYTVLCRSQGICCYTLDGYRRTSTDELHTWNRVFYDDAWWNLDPSVDGGRLIKGKSLYGFHRLSSRDDPDEEYEIIRIY